MRGTRTRSPAAPPLGLAARRPDADRRRPACRPRAPALRAAHRAWRAGDPRPAVDRLVHSNSPLGSGLRRREASPFGDGCWFGDVVALGVVDVQATQDVEGFFVLDV